MYWLTVLTQNTRQAAIAIGGEPLQGQLHPCRQIGIDDMLPQLGPVIQAPPGEPQPAVELDERYHMAFLGQLRLQRPYEFSSSSSRRLNFFSA
ncbi:hypothetical protein BC443_18060 [Salinicola sp. MIT1003]|nr:hypothetical protein BC443_18060 [Salinicola sp. MIT1003]